MAEIGVNAAFIVRRAAEKLRNDSLAFMPGGWDEIWRLAMADAWEECASQMELIGAEEVRFLGNTGMPGSPKFIVVNRNTGRGDLVWTRLLAAARAYLGGEPGGGSEHA